VVELAPKAIIAEIFKEEVPHPLTAVSDPEEALLWDVGKNKTASSEAIVYSD